MAAEEALFHIFLGDFVYVDVPLAGVGLGTQVDRYATLYRMTLEDADVTALLHSTPGFFMYGWEALFVAGRLPLISGARFYFCLAGTTTTRFSTVRS